LAEGLRRVRETKGPSRSKWKSIRLLREAHLSMERGPGGQKLIIKGPGRQLKKEAGEVYTRGVKKSEVERVRICRTKGR